MGQVGVVRQAESAALKAAGLTETGKKSGTFKRELAAVFSQVKLWAPVRRREGAEHGVAAVFSVVSSSRPGGIARGQGRWGGVG